MVGNWIHQFQKSSTLWKKGYGPYRPPQNPLSFSNPEPNQFGPLVEDFDRVRLGLFEKFTIINRWWAKCVDVDLVSMSSTSYEQFFANFLLPKNSNTKFQDIKAPQNTFFTKNFFFFVKRWWHWLWLRCSFSTMLFKKRMKLDIVTHCSWQVSTLLVTETKDTIISEVTWGEYI